MFLGLALNTWLGLSVLGAIVSTVGSLCGVVLKELFLSRSFERWKQRQTLEQLYQKFKDPLHLSACELASRVAEILNNFPTNYLNRKVLALRPERQIANSIHDFYYQRYKLISTGYRISAFFAWVELHRQEVTFLHPGNNKHSRELESAIGIVRSDLADGQLNDAEDWDQWRDTLVFREELRAIGESLIEVRGSARSVMGYGKYCEQLESTSPNAVQRWSPIVLNFFLDLDSNGKDFRQVRLKRLLVHLVDLLNLIDRESIPPHLEKVSAAFRGQIK